jgi:hypothetical protein
MKALKFNTADSTHVQLMSQGNQFGTVSAISNL